MGLLRLLDWMRHRARLRVWNHDRAWGRRGEDLAHRHLRRAGYTVVARNYRSRSGSGEVDLVAWEGATLVFVEVKTRTTDDIGSPDRAVTEEKQRRLILAGAEYARRAGVRWEQTRFDVVSIVLKPTLQIELQRDAFAKSESSRRGAV